MIISRGNHSFITSAENFPKHASESTSLGLASLSGRRRFSSLHDTPIFSTCRCTAVTRGTVRVGRKSLVSFIFVTIIEIRGEASGQDGDGYLTIDHTVINKSTENDIGVRIDVFIDYFGSSVDLLQRKVWPAGHVEDDPLRSRDGKV